MEAKEILFAYDRMPRCYGTIRISPRSIYPCPEPCWRACPTPNFKAGFMAQSIAVSCSGTCKMIACLVLGTGYYHPVLALTLEADWDEHIARWQGIARHLLWRNPFNGFWPPEMGFDMRMIPHLKRPGIAMCWWIANTSIRSVRCTGRNCATGLYIAEYGGEQIVIIVRDRELSGRATVRDGLWLVLSRAA